MAFLSFMDANPGPAQRGPARHGSRFDSNPDVYSMEEQALDNQRRKAAAQAAEQAAFQKQANPLSPEFVRGVGGVTAPEWEVMQREIYGG